MSTMDRSSHTNKTWVIDPSAHCWVRCDDQPGVEGMYCSECEKWAEISKGIQTWVKEEMADRHESVCVGAADCVC